ncbi:MAG: hypothetical protein M5U19_10340 [Microthrixaceae bacterium]|nr:hypothetical protein [Microthrixaceae bacterium]
MSLTWPERYGGSDSEGVYEYILNEALAGKGGPQIGKGVGHHRQDPDRPRLGLPQRSSCR